MQTSPAAHLADSPLANWQVDLRSLSYLVSEVPDFELAKTLANLLLSPPTLNIAMSNKEVIESFYKAFARHDAEAMAALYHDDIKFSDPVFGTLKGEQAKNMWRMLIERGKQSLSIRYSNVQASDTNGTANWTADYLFSTTGNMVDNEISASFEFKDGKIIRHTDYFSFWKWSRQALGTTGLLLGWTPILKKKVSEQAKKGLEKYSKSRA